ncbi:zinc-binding metallopeptidase [Sphingobacterium luzhongxinii]|uniref:zinc-binding metallopeptidase n=1 Tax=Sphingobacterium luzhongxinii TaxID=2654181 RepID=UPI0013DB05E5|nr:putative zinc-binding metallopeptidase [Sphingobacterium sp. xlx-73]
MKKYSIYILVSFLFITNSCKKEKLDPNSVLEDRTQTQSVLDKYIDRTYITPYNIAILYKYVHMESDLNYNLSPASLESSTRMSRLLAFLGLEPYDELTGNKEFIKNYFPKVLNYVGSPAYNNNGTIVLGTAEGGRKITLYNLNQLRGANTTDIDYLNYWYFHTIHHEFGHILNQTKPFSASFREISGSDYVNDAWNDLYDEEGALDDGFISPYAAKSAGEDFVELYSFYITLTAQQWEDKISQGSEEGQAVIQTKLDIVKNYFETSWGIDIDKMRTIVTRRQTELKDFDQLAIN